MKKALHPPANTPVSTGRLSGNIYYRKDKNGNPAQLPMDDQTGKQRINCNGMLPLLPEAINEQQQHIEELKIK